VTSGRLASATVRHRLFPKTRSWFTLGAPLELLSPLSVLRILFALAVLWPVVGIAGGIPARAIPALLAVTAVYAATWVALMRTATAGPRTCEVLAAVLIVGTAAVIHQSGGAPGLALSDLAFAPAVALFAGLFFGVRGLQRYAAVVLVATWVALIPLAGGLLAAGLLALAVAVVAVAVATTVRLLCRSARDQNTSDADTGLPNGFGLARRAATWSEACFVVAVVHLAGLAEAREALGYPAGTELLRRAVENVGQVIPDGLVGRVEADEIVVVLAYDPDTTTNGDAEATGSEASASKATATAESLADQLIAAVSGPRYLVGGIEISLRAHVGATVAPEDGDDVVELIRLASLAARRAHHQGRPALIRDGDTGALTSSDLSLLSDLSRAVNRGELRLVYQPQVVPRTGEVASVEALLRWESDAHGPVSPAVFVPLAERTGLIARLTDWVLTEALAAAARWADAGHPLSVSVNLSAVDLARVDLAERVVRELALRRVDPGRLTLEVTETAATADMLHAIEQLRPVRDLGVRIAIDDFGTGYTSLSLLPKLALDELKVDQRFVMHCLTSPADDAIVGSVCDLGHRLGLEVVAEGVEDGACAAHLTDLGFDLLQGYAFAAALSEAELLELLRSGATLSPAAGPGAAPGGGQAVHAVSGDPTGELVTGALS
jgi:EAL domain-containing protein (putative c-di-GMP-specific phosphodiesterase class I)/GGDEF domain-containing protein